MSASLVLTFSGIVNGDTIALPIAGSGTLAVTVDWGDGTTTTDTTLTHEYTANFNGNVTITVTAGTVTRFGNGYIFTSWDGASNLTTVDTINDSLLNWGLPGISVLSGAFFNATNIVTVPDYIPSTVTDCGTMFLNSDKFNHDISGWNTSNIEIMSLMLNGCKKFDQDISGWDVSSATTMDSMFSRCYVFNQDIGNWDVSNVQNFSQMFYANYLFNQDISGWDVSGMDTGGAGSFSTNGMISMFAYAWAFNQDIGNWDVSNGERFDRMFDNAISFNQDISRWDTSSAQDISYMFNNATSFSCDIRRWDVTNVNTAFQAGFAGMTNSATAFISLYNNKVDTLNYGVAQIATNPAPDYFNQTPALLLTFDNSDGGVSVTIPIIGSGVTATINWGEGDGDITGVTSFEHTFKNTGVGGYVATPTVTITVTAGTVTGFGTANNNTWTGVDKLTHFQTTDFNTFGLGTSITNFTSAFNGANSLTNNTTLNNTKYSIPNNLPSTITNIQAVFKDNTAFNNPNITLWNTSNVTDMNNMFNGATVFNQDISGWNTSTVTDMSNMFNGANDFTQDITGWNTSTVTNMSGMFQSNTIFNQNISGWTISAVTDMSNMFNGATVFNQYIGGWTTSAVTDMSGMFNGAIVFNQDISGWTTSAVTDMSNMFNGAIVFKQKICIWNPDVVTDLNDMFLGATSMLGTFFEFPGIGTTPTKGSVVDRGFFFWEDVPYLDLVLGDVSLAIFNPTNQNPYIQGLNIGELKTRYS